MDYFRANFLRHGAAALACFGAASLAAAQPKGAPASPKVTGPANDEAMIDVAKACPAIRIELRYATTRNFTGKPIYPPNARCIARQSLVLRLQRAQEELRAKGFGLKIWDAYRPAWAQNILWKAAPNPDFVGPPGQGGSMHTRGMAVDATLVDGKGRELPMPTDFDDFTPAALMHYPGADHAVARRLRILQTAMGRAGFLGMRTEWWHFVAPDYATAKPVDLKLEAEISAR